MGYCNRLDTEAGRKIQLSYITLNIKNICRNVKQCKYFHLKFILGRMNFYNMLAFNE